MATCADIITDALKLARVLPTGGSPTADESSDGLNCLQSLYDSWVHGTMFGTLEDVYLDADDVAEEGKRYHVPSGVTLTDATSDYVDADNVTRQPRDLSLYEANRNGTRTVKLYDRTAWVELTGLELTNTAPMSGRDRMGLAAALATYGAFAAMFGDTASLNPDVRNAALRFLGSIASKQGTTQDNAGAVYY
jgi:hypothetical protein